jgi:hypothetical protein
MPASAGVAILASPVEDTETTMNSAWHAAHPMPKNPTLDQRIAWHLAHAKACGCRAITDKLRDEIAARGIAVPVFKGRVASR